MEVLAQGVRLCEPDETFSEHDETNELGAVSGEQGVTFRTRYSDIPGWGEICLVGIRPYSPQPTDRGIFVADKIYKTAATRYSELECFYNIYYEARPYDLSSRRLHVVQLDLPEEDEVLEGSAWFDEEDLDGIPLSEFRISIYEFYASGGDPQSYLLFGLKNAPCLSTLRFNFGYRPNTDL